MTTDIEEDTIQLWLPDEEIVNRFLADLLNDTQDHERTLLQYGMSGHDYVRGGEPISPMDPLRFDARLRAGFAEARAKVESPAWKPTHPFSIRRMQSLRQFYG
jgi:hypothetical protein